MLLELPPLSSFFSCFLPLCSMGFFIDDSGLIVTHLIYKAALIFAVFRWVFSCFLKFRDWNLSAPSMQHPPVPSSVPSQLIKESLISTTFDEIQDRLPQSCCDTCAVCLNHLGQQDEVRELRNCRHAFHKQCIDRWVDHDDDDNHKTCPLCRMPFLTSSQVLCWSRSEPSWAVEHLLYLFGDDLLT